MNVPLLSSIILYIAGMLAIGYAAYRRTSNLSEYVLGGRRLGPAVTALSAGASDMSGWLMMGLPGAMFVSGLSASWIVIGLTLGAFANWLYMAPRLRAYTELANNSITIPSFLENRFGDRSRLLRLVSGIVIMVFFTFYVSAGIVSGGILFENTFQTSYTTGVLLITGVVVAYTLFGGFLAVSWTDFVQGIIMIVALILVPAVTIWHTGGAGAAFQTIREVDPALFDMFKGTSAAAIASLFAWGLGYFGQPHIIVRFMAIKSVGEIKKARTIGMAWMIFSIGGAMFTGFVGIAYFHREGLSLTNPETIFIRLSEILFHPVITGFLLAAILAAIMSTISSQLLVTSSSLTEDLYKTFFRRAASERELVLAGRISVLLVALVALWLASNKNGTILSLVGYAWAGFGASFGPVILFSLYWKRMTRWGAFAGMLAGAVTVIVWPHLPVVHVLYEIIPGFFACSAAIVIVSLWSGEPDESTQQQFERYEHAMRG